MIHSYRITSWAVDLAWIKLRLARQFLTTEDHLNNTLFQCEYFSIMVYFTKALEVTVLFTSTTSIHLLSIEPWAGAKKALS